ncbi:transcriptional regulator [Sphaerisporangium melleum]|uniref:Transcriptional regulator n=1 Tax=Sphaerisporangium melleum TaxID=321316 RepID=A0A917QTA6_9ACTN|nr:helix-turn-helix transcriptional regulator [Sphaerisporangium melleum]GGK66176.1 transcriptional regulator [Sphaerisporangium melleum]GII68631.1 transcriptional regulator [Sphaerisporangium melleum]
MSISPERAPDMKPLMLFGSELRKHRKRTGLSQERLAQIIRFSPSLVGFIERGQRTPGRDFVQRCDAALQTGGELLRLWNRVTGEATPGWFRSWLDIEQEAHTLHTWQPLYIPGLLQTEEYARIVIRGEPGISDEQVEKLVAGRLERQAILTRTNAPLFRAVLDEGILHRPIGGKEVMRTQLARLTEAVRSPRVGLQIVPLSTGATTGLLGGFVIAQLSGGTDAVYIDSATHGHVTNRLEDVKAVHSRYDAIRAEALPAHVSIELIREAEKTWT